MQKKSQSKGTNYKFNQLFGYKGPGQKILEEDIISHIKFDSTGKYLSLGDKAGRIIIFQAEQNSKKKDQQYEYFTQFQSHTKQFDPLRSMDVQEEITGINWLRSQGKYHKMVTTNSKNIKLWKIYQKTQKKIVKNAGKDLNIPKLQNIQTAYQTQPQKIFPAQHLSTINSISSTYNEEYLLSSDDVHAFLWNFQDPSKPYLVADILGKQKIEQLKENINFSKMHPTTDNLFLFGTNKGNLKMCDLRISANADNTAVNFKQQTAGQKNFLTQFISGCSSAEFIKNNKYIASRDFLSVKIWDICNPKKPLSSVNIQESLKGKLSEMFENQAIFDKFTVSCSSDGQTIATGSYNNCFHLIDFDGTNTQYELNYKKNTISKQILPGKSAPLTKMDYVKKTVALDFSPIKNTVAVASLNCFYMYSM